jgi:MoaD family protein
MVKLRLFAALRELAGSKEVEVQAQGDALSIAEALEQLAARFGDKARGILFDKQGAVQSSVLLLVNGEPAQHGAATRVKPGDTVAVLLPTAGG